MDELGDAIFVPATRIYITAYGKKNPVPYNQGKQDERDMSVSAPIREAGSRGCKSIHTRTALPPECNFTDVVMIGGSHMAQKV